MSVRKKDNESLYERVQEQNLLRQYDLLTNCIEIGLEKGIEAFDKYTLWSLNHTAVANIACHGGRYREQPILVGNHIPPHFNEVEKQMDIMFAVVHENWTLQENPVALAAFVLWKLNWIHPFVEGNGRTARAAAYYLICMKEGRLLPGRKIIPERIRENRAPYYAALRAADAEFQKGQYNIGALAGYLQVLLRDQIAEGTHLES